MQAKTAQARSCEHLFFGALFVVLLLGTTRAFAQAAGAAGAPTRGKVQSITLEQAIGLAEANDPAYAASLAGRGSAELDRSISRSALLPQVFYNNQYLYTQGTGHTAAAATGVGLTAAPRYIANNGVHEYVSQGTVNETLSLAAAEDYRRTGALARKADADSEIARRDLVARVVSGYFGLIAADGRLSVAQQAEGEAKDFAGLTGKLEAGREVAHGDVAKADLSLQQREREFADAQLTAEKARLDLGVLLFADPRTSYTVAGNSLQPPALPPQAEVEAQAAARNPDLASALEQTKAAHDEVDAARGAYLPALALNYYYGIDATQFAVHGPLAVPEQGGAPDRVRNLGYSASATLNIPVWDWFATHDRVKQSQFRQKAAQVALTSVERALIAQLQEFYDEAKVAFSQMASLDQSVKTAEESLRLTRLRYGAGEATALEVVDAQNTLALTEAARVEGSVRYRVALANLQTLTGAL